MTFTVFSNRIFFVAPRAPPLVPQSVFHMERMTLFRLQRELLEQCRDTFVDLGQTTDKKGLDVKQVRLATMIHRAVDESLHIAKNLPSDSINYDERCAEARYSFIIIRVCTNCHLIICNFESCFYERTYNNIYICDSYI